MDLGVRKALLHIADRQQFKVRNAIIEGPPFPDPGWTDRGSGMTSSGTIV
jgi:hypothetical protein